MLGFFLARTDRLTGLCILLLGCAPWTRRSEHDSPASVFPQATNLTQLLNLAESMQNTLLPVHLEGVVCWLDPGRGHLVALQADSRVAFLQLDLPSESVSPGDTLVIDGNCLVQFAEHLGSEQARTLDELRSLAANVEHIMEIVAMQQNYARISGVSERVPAKALMEDALRMSQPSIEGDYIQLQRDYQEPLPEIQVDRYKVLQILLNLLDNARNACVESDHKAKAMTVRLSCQEQRVRFSVADNGVGIATENLTRIFQHGFTTRQRGHGFGLHSGALAAKELGGALAAFSDGPGKGATFTLELPLTTCSQ